MRLPFALPNNLFELGGVDDFNYNILKINRHEKNISSTLYPLLRL